MNINITARKVRIPKGLIDYINEKFSKCQKYFSHIIKIDVILSQQKYVYSVEVLLNVASQIVRINQNASDFRSAVDLAADKLERQLVKQKEKLKMRRRKAKNSADENYILMDELFLDMNRRKLIPEVISIEEAKNRIDKYSYAFWIFLNRENSRLSVIYRKADLTYGLIEIEKG